MKINYHFSLIHFGCEKVKNHIFAIVLILSAILSSHVCLSSTGTLHESIAILYSNNINGEIDPCPS